MIANNNSGIQQIPPANTEALFSRTEIKHSRTQAQKGSVTPVEVYENELKVQGSQLLVKGMVGDHH
jgi:hypothetical protein